MSNVNQGSRPVAGPSGARRLDAAFDSLVPKDAAIESVAGGFQFTDYPLRRSEGMVWFSDVTGNVLRSVSLETVVIGEKPLHQTYQ
jgi:hypothetical protein